MMSHLSTQTNGVDVYSFVGTNINGILNEISYFLTQKFPFHFAYLLLPKLASQLFLSRLYIASPVVEFIQET